MADSTRRGKGRSIDMSERQVYSFSRISTECDHAFYMTYVKNDKGIENAWSIGGSFLHSIMERVARKEISETDALRIFENEWQSSVHMDFPKFESGYDLKSHYFRKIRKFFDRKRYWRSDVVSVEEHVTGVLGDGGNLFQGFIDLVLGNSEQYDILDFKISKRFTGEQLVHKQRQLYLYAYLRHQITGVYPQRLIFNFFQEPDNPIIIKFDRIQMMNAVSWANKRIEEIEAMLERGIFIPDRNALSDSDGRRNMLCRELCNHRNTCPFVNGEWFKK